jgi:hypothetical protein
MTTAKAALGRCEAKWPYFERPASLSLSLTRMNSPGFLLAFSAVGLVSGAAIVTAAYMLYKKPSQAQTWGTIVLVFAVVSLLSAGGFIIGALLGIVGGLLALTWRRPT